MVKHIFILIMTMSSLTLKGQNFKSDSLYRIGIEFLRLENYDEAYEVLVDYRSQNKSVLRKHKKFRDELDMHINEALDRRVISTTILDSVFVKDTRLKKPYLSEPMEPKLNNKQNKVLKYSDKMDTLKNNNRRRTKLTSKANNN
jgi:hypothetical protein